MIEAMAIIGSLNDCSVIGNSLYYLYNSEGAPRVIVPIAEQENC